MEYRKLAYVENKVSTMFFGTAMEPFLSGETNYELLDRIYELGINTFDMARNYAGAVMDAAAMQGYGYPENFERLRRCEQLAKEKGVLVPQLAMAWIFKQHLNMFAVVSTSKAERMKQNIEALDIPLSEEEVRYLNLQ